MFWMSVTSVVSGGSSSEMVVTRYVVENTSKSYPNLSSEVQTYKNGLLKKIFLEGYQKGSLGY